jgi:hypothetical protein
MSSRIRIAYIPAGLGRVHSGSQAVKAMQGVYINSHLQSGITIFPMPPKELKGRARAEWLWRHTPPMWKQGATFVLARQLRKTPWKRCPAHPNVIGAPAFVPRKKVKEVKAPPVIGVPPGVSWNSYQFQPAATLPVSTGLLQAAEKAVKAEAKRILENIPKKDPRYSVPRETSPEPSKKKKSTLAIGVWA